MNRSKNILICPLEWGLGHASRMIPLARRLQELNNNIYVASGEEHLALFRAELQGITCINFGGFKPRYSRKIPQYLWLLFKIPALIFHIISEHQRIKKIIYSNAIDIIISDNRFGLWNSKITSVYVTHMPRVPFPVRFRFLEPVGMMLHRMIIKKYDFCFIPDLPGNLNLSGRLSHGLNLPGNVRFTGILSRFSNAEKFPDSKSGGHITVILSGPEPQKQILKDNLIMHLQEEAEEICIFEGKPLIGGETGRIGNITLYSHLPAPRMKEIIEGSKAIICRSGYTSIMELVSMNCTALIIPTPGQTEQEYLADYLSAKGWFSTVRQDQINAGFQIPPAKIFLQSEINRQSPLLLNAALDELLKKDHKSRESGKSGE